MRAPGISSVSEIADSRLRRILHKAAANGTSTTPIGLSREISTRTIPSKTCRFQLLVKGASRTKQASSPKCHWIVVAFALTSYVLGRARYRKAATTLFGSAMFENRDERNKLTGNICTAIAHTFITSGAKENGKTNVSNAL